MSSIAVIGCGNLARSDDGAGPAVVSELARRGLGTKDGVRLLDAGTDGMTVMHAARGCRTLILVDAARSGSLPGSVFEVPGAELENRPQPSYSLHDFRWDHALYAARRMYAGQFPDDIVVLLIESATTAFGLELSSPVRDAVDRVADRIAGLVQSRLEARA